MPRSGRWFGSRPNGATEGARRGVIVERIAWHLVRELTLFGGPLGVLIAVYYALWGDLTRSTSRLAAVRDNLLLYTVYSVVLFAFGRIYLRRRLGKVTLWLDEGRPPDEAETRAIVTFPARFARDIAGVFVVMAGVTSSGNLRFGGFTAEVVRVFTGLTLVGLMFAALAYLIAERALRPLFERMDLDVRQARVGVRSRVLLGWALGSGIPLLFILAIPLQGTGSDRLPITVPMIFMACTGLITGVVAMIAVTRSIADPLREVRTALARVQKGDLDASVPVDDPGEIGLLQHGFNQMVEGLRERRLIEDLFGRHVGEEVARRALQTGADFAGELRVVAVMFIDIVGSTTLSETGGPREVVALLNEFFGEVVGAVRRSGGWVNKFEGDAALCVFGAPMSQDDAATAALEAALALRDALHPLPLDAGIGVSVGEVVAGNVGAEDRYEYTVIGPAVNEAARLSDYAKDVPERLVVDARVVRAARVDGAAWRDAGEIAVKGVTRPLAIVVPTDGNP